MKMTLSLRVLGPFRAFTWRFRQETAVDKNAARPTMTPLIHSTTNSALVAASETTGLFPVPSFQQSQADLLSAFVPTAGTNILALKLTGEFATAFLMAILNGPHPILIVMQPHRRHPILP